MATNIWKVLAWAVADEPMVRKWRMLRPIIRRGPEIVLRKSASWNRMPYTQIKSPDLFIGISPWAEEFPEDDRRYEIKTNEDWEDKTFHVKIKEYQDKDGLFKKQWFVRYTVKNKDGKDEEFEKPFTINEHNRVGISQYFKDYNSEKNKYKPLKWRKPFLSIFSDEIDTLIDEKDFNEIYK